MTRKGSALTLSVSEHEKAQLEQLALTFGQTWGSKPNISKLIKAIATGEIRVAANHDWSRGRIDALNRIRNHCVDHGYLNEARAIAELLLERSEINLPLRQEVQAFLDKTNVAWRVDLDRCILAQRPFSLTYQDAAGRVLSFTIRHAKIVIHEDRQYLDCWCEEAEPRRDILATVHNWSLRLDRIPAEAVISIARGHWQPKLDFVDVEFWLLNDLAFSYRCKTQADLANEWLTEQQVRRIIRRVNHTFWFFREIRRYGANCVVIGPEEVRSRFAEEIIKMAKHYQSS